MLLMKPSEDATPESFLGMVMRTLVIFVTVKLKHNRCCRLWENERNLTLIAPRRMGKTGLIKCLLYPARGETGSC